MTTCKKCGVETVCEFELCSKCYNTLNFPLIDTNSKGMYDNNPQARNTCSQCGKETRPENDVCLACEMEDYMKEQRGNV